MRLLPRQVLLKTGSQEAANGIYRPLVGWIRRQRFALASNLIKAQRYSRLLEIGYGDGVFMPELAKYCGELHGVDIRSNFAAVKTALADFDVKANLCPVGAESLPFDDEYFDCVVAVSSLEFIENLEKACEEIDRVLTPSGRLIVVTPGAAGRKWLPGEHQRSIESTVMRWFKVESVPTALHGLYQALDCRRKPRVAPPLQAPRLVEQTRAPQPAAVLPITSARARRASYRPVLVTPDRPAEDLWDEHLIGDLSRTTPEELERAILTVRRRRVVMANQRSEERIRESA